MKCSRFSNTWASCSFNSLWLPRTSLPTHHISSHHSRFSISFFPSAVSLNAKDIHRLEKDTLSSQPIWTRCFTLILTTGDVPINFSFSLIWVLSGIFLYRVRSNYLNVEVTCIWHWNTRFILFYFATCIQIFKVLNENVQRVIDLIIIWCGQDKGLDFGSVLFQLILIHKNTSKSAQIPIMRLLIDSYLKKHSSPSSLSHDLFI